MWFSAIANYKGGLAHYKVTAEDLGIFNAYLERYDGKSGNTPPPRIILVRGASQWSGSVEDQELLNKIGEVVDRRTKGRLHVVFENNMKQKRKGSRH